MNRRQVVSGLVSVAAVLAGGKMEAAVQSGYIDQIRVLKRKRTLQLLSDGKMMREYNIRLGFNPEGSKRFFGDGRTPEGRYRIEGRNPFSRFHLSLKIDYPNDADRRFAYKHGRSPGGEIFIHGQVNGSRYTNPADWTEGCIALSDADMDEVWKYVPIGCVIDIKP